MGDAVAEQQVVHLAGLVMTFQGPADGHNFAPEPTQFVRCQLGGLRHMTTLPDDVCVAASQRPPAEIRVAPLTLEDSDAARLPLRALVSAHGAADTTPLRVPVGRPALGHDGNCFTRALAATSGACRSGSSTHTRTIGECSLTSRCTPIWMLSGESFVDSGAVGVRPESGAPPSPLARKPVAECALYPALARLRRGATRQGLRPHLALVMGGSPHGVSPQIAEWSAPRPQA